ncbi:hypothetical protein KIH86_22975 [Paenibacillus sp. HN-1]|uniref:hypothetical protein n=1 Tax=Paenibacillus TaxID=44249 RepID=UPI001CA8213F|nr:MULTISPECIES: hypothetical protein [Paenibacillus]MBY9081019.1 hypothetical protein [Paenibacillus sp. CGMCC 1.18879]MBY9087056.1 hypothetical protein [Paenibacillus sinensis]
MSEIDYTKVTCSTWTPEQLAKHLRRIGADKPPVRRPNNDFETCITAPKQGRWSRYLK